MPAPLVAVAVEATATRHACRVASGYRAERDTDARSALSRSAPARSARHNPHMRTALIVVLGSLALPAAAPAQATLTLSQFAAVDAVYVAFAPFDDGATTTERAAARAACTALGSADSLLSALRRACFPQLRIGRALGQTQRCEGRSSCVLAARAVQWAATDYLMFARAANRVVGELGLAPACARELRRGAAELRFVTDLRSAYAQLERALRARSKRLTERAQRRIDALRLPESRPAAQQREAYRAGCAPPG